MPQAKNVRIDPLAIQQKSISLPRAKAASVSFGDIMTAAAPLAGEATYWGTGNPNAANVIHAAFSALPASYAGTSGGYAGSVLGDLPGIMGAPRYATTASPYGSGGMGNIPGTEVPQAELINTMNENNLQLLELQATMQNNMQQWTTKSNILKSIHEAKMAMIQKFTTQG